MRIELPAVLFAAGFRCSVPQIGSVLPVPRCLRELAGSYGSYYLLVGPSNSLDYFRGVFPDVSLA